MAEFHLQSDLFSQTDNKEQILEGDSPSSNFRGLIEPEFSENAHSVLRKRYLKRSASGEILEKPADMLLRVAEAVASAEEKFGNDGKQMLRFFCHLCNDKIAH